MKYWGFLTSFFTYVAFSDSTIKIKTSNADVLVNEDALLQCYVSDVINELSLEMLGVEWSFRNETNKYKVYTFDGVEAQYHIFGPRVYVSQEQLKKGNASLLLSKVHFSHEGIYECVIFVTPNKDEGTLQLTVSAMPNVTLSDEEILANPDTEKSVGCEIKNFYPENIAVKWLEIKESSEVEVSEEETDICIGSPVQNKDGTFNVKSRLTLHPKLQDSGKRFRCQVSHRTYPDRYGVDAVLSVREPESSPLGLILGFLFGLAGIVITIVVYWLRFKPVPPKDVTVEFPEHLKHEEECTFKCEIRNFRPMLKTVIFFIKKKGMDRKLCYQWPISTAINTQTKDECRITLCGHEYIQPDSLFKNVKEEKEMYGDGTQRLSFHITTFPNIYLDHEAEFTVSAEHKSLAEPIKAVRQFKVVGAPPRLSNIVVPPRIVHGELLALTCMFMGHKPRKLSVTWKKNGNKIAERDSEYKYEKVSTSEKYSHNFSDSQYTDDYTFSATSVLMFIPTVKDDDAKEFSCDVYHESSGHREEKSHKLNVIALPKLEIIKSSPDVPKSNESLTLSCRIHSFYPNNIKITWYKGEEVMKEAPENSDATVEENGLFYCTSRLTFKPVKEDVGKTFFCRAGYQNIEQIRETEWKMKELVSVPKLTNIQSSDTAPEIGKEITLSCSVDKYFPPDCTVIWVRGFERTVDGVTVQEPQEIANTGLYRRETCRIFKPKADDHGIEFSMEVVHYGITYRPEKPFCLHFKGIPVVGEITVEPKNPSYGKFVQLTCDVRGFYPKNISTHWLQNNKQLDKGITIEGPFEDSSGVFNLKSSLKIKLTAEDFNREIFFCVQHQTLNEPVKKRAEVYRPSSQPVLSDINVTPSYPEAGAPVHLKLDITSFAPKDITVRWFKGSDIISASYIKTNSPRIADNGLYFTESEFTFSPEKHDQNVFIRCEVHHLTTEEIKEKGCYLKLKGVPSLSEITCSPKMPSPGNKVILCCKATGFTSDKLIVRWYKDKTPIPHGCSLIGPARGTDGYYFTAELKLTAALSDRSTDYSVKVLDVASNSQLEKVFRITLAVEVQKSEICCVTESPNAGDEVQFCCFVSEYSIDDVLVTWYNGYLPVTKGVKNEMAHNGLGFNSYLHLQTETNVSEYKIKCVVTSYSQSFEYPYLLKL
ncbi:uncharacterized protein LOC122811112 [Protopterus annectens]|uniref:uncharacterized protein LOC122811112 n=1 Tax=Protopterus annectens TaxID=7888 RepID=UPI001CFA260D|nr:uncharacterized protein LOC122811112 [Protopterus annectens]